PVTAGGLTLRNSTIANNEAPYGGGMWLNTPGQVIIQNCSIVNNWYDGIEGPATGTLSLESSVLKNVYRDIYSNGTVKATTCAILNSSHFTLTNLRGNLPFGIDLKLAYSLQNNGGPTYTVALLPGSPCIDAGSNPAGLTTDQRGSGFDRSWDGAPDIG